jgi:CRP/FNR family transcriptional regulator
MSDDAIYNSELESLFKTGSEQSYKKGSLIVKPGDPKSNVYYLTKGYVKVYVIGKNGSEHIHALLTPGFIFPLVILFGMPPLQLHFAALSDAHVMCLKAEDFKESIQSKASLCFETLQMLTKIFSTYMLRVDNLEFKFARERLAYRLLTLGAKLGVSKNSEIFLPHINQYDIGAMINLSRESVSRELSRFERLGYIGHQGSSIIIKDVSALQREIGLSKDSFDRLYSEYFPRISEEFAT